MATGDYLFGNDNYIQSGDINVKGENIQVAIEKSTDTLYFVGPDTRAYEFDDENKDIAIEAIINGGTEYSTMPGVYSLLGKNWKVDTTNNTFVLYDGPIESEIEKTQTEEENENQADLINKNRANITEKMQVFAGILDNLDNKFCKNRAVYTMYFKMVIPGVGTLVDTASKEWLENNLISFTHNMNGSGEANTFTLEILFKPHDRTFKSIMGLENKLLAACQVYESEKELKSVDDIYNNCTFIYGYGDDISLRSPEYYGTIMDYDCKLENGNLRYTITGYDGLYTSKEYRISAKSEYLTDAGGATINDPMSYIARIFEVEFKDNNLYKVKFINIEKDKVTYPGESYKQFNQKNIFQVIKDILSGCMTTDQYNAASGTSTLEGEEQGPPSPARIFSPNQKQIFSYYIDNKPDSNGGKYGTVYIYKMESIYGEENKSKTEETISADCNITFGWFAPSAGAYNHIVKSWSPKFKGSILMAMATTYKQGSDKYYTMDDNGDIKEVTSLGAARLGQSEDETADKYILSTVQEYDNWAFPTQYPYQASMTTIGVPCEVPMTGTIKIIAKMGSEKHHSSGVYIVLGKTDKISSGGFFSDFELFKITEGYNPNYKIIKTDEELDTSNEPQDQYPYFEDTKIEESRFDQLDINNDEVLNASDFPGRPFSWTQETDGSITRDEFDSGNYKVPIK